MIAYLPRSLGHSLADITMNYPHLVILVGPAGNIMSK